LRKSALSFNKYAAEILTILKNGAEKVIEVDAIFRNNEAFGKIAPTNIRHTRLRS
jgi:hypothetical protein